MAPTVEERRLRALITKKEYFFSYIQQLFDLSKNLQDAESRRKFNCLVGSLDRSRVSLAEVLDEIVQLSMELDDKFVPNYEVLGTVEEMCGAIEEAQRELRRVEGDKATAVKRSAAAEQPAIRLPHMELLHFSGDLKEWEAFYGVFKRLVHNNPQLSDMEKLYYLVGCLEGSARSVLSGVSLAEENYESVWESLVERFHDTRSLANAYLGQILEWRDTREESDRGLTSFLEKFDAAVRSLRRLRVRDLADFMFVSFALARLNPETVKYFELNRQSDSIPDYEELRSFIRLRVKNMGVSKLKSFSRQRESEFPKSKVSAKSFVVNKSRSLESGKRCEYCRKTGHTLPSCVAFLNLKPNIRYVKVKELNLCYNCFSADHGVRNCPLSSQCDACGYNHHKLIHHERPSTTPVEEASKEKEGEHVSLYCAGAKERSIKATTVLLGTVKVELEGPFGSCVGRFLLDNGSQANLISGRLCHKLGLPVKKISSSIQGLGGVNQTVRGSTTFTVATKTNKKLLVSALVLGKITGNLPHTRVNLHTHSWLQSLPLADSDFGRPGPIEGILGAEIFAEVVGSNHLKEQGNGPTALETDLGYVVMGRIPAAQEPVPQTFLATMETPSVEQLVQQFWAMEAVPDTRESSVEEEKCEKIFQEEVCRDETGRFTVALPFKLEPNQLGDSKMMARKRYFALETKLKRNADLKAGYHKAMQDFIDQGHLYPVREEADSSPSYYIPHHAVYKATSSSTPVRIVLDASAPTDNGLSLNSILHVGPKLQSDIGGLLIRFRLFSVALVGDIKQMYRQINLIQPHWKFQRIYWRWSPEEPLGTWELGTLAFGVTSSPYLALRCIQELLQQEGNRCSGSAQLVKEGLYVDDLVVSVPTVRDAEILYDDAVELLQRGRFELTKWMSNSMEFLEKIPVERRMKGNTAVQFEEQTSILGLVWSPKNDVLVIRFPSPAPECTKRNVLASVARCFDPLGLSAPLTLHLKVLIKELWSLRLDWDEEPPHYLQQKWRKIQSEWSELSKVEVKRSCEATYDTSIKLFGFADASKDGYGGVIYLLKENEPTGLQLVCAKSRVSPMKPTSIPRLELCAALLLTNLMSYVLDILDKKLKISDIFGFSDSSTVLQWLLAEELKDIFVRNRVTRIREKLPKMIWSHISGKDNPADGLSRGLSPAQLAANKAWFNGPSWVYSPEELWPCTKFGSAPAFVKVFSAVQETATSSSIHPLLELVERKSSWSDILRITVWVLRGLKLIPKGNHISAADLRTAELNLVKLVQHQHFGADIQLLQNGKEPTARLRKLCPFIQDGVLRVGGRLAHSRVPFDQRHQLILPKEAALTERLIDYYHVKHFHTGAYLVDALLRQRWWILRGRSLIKKKIRACNRCFRLQPKSAEPLMADLPPQRVNQTKAFLHTGVDYFGPIRITLGRRRGSAVMKAYVALFVCMAVKAVHLELVSSLSTEHFLQAFKRFLARRGPCKVIYSDRGTNFVGARKVLSDLSLTISSEEYGKAMGKAFADRGIEWQLNPASAPHMGGLWESQVKTAKRHIFRVVGDQLLTYEEFNTLLVQIEALMNSRPLCQLSADPEAPSALTPAHFLYGAPLEDLPAENVLEAKSNRLNRFQLLDQMVQSFWRRWKLEYLTTLQERQKWSHRTANLETGTVVVLRMENTPPLQWPLAVITGVFPGRDGVVRTVKVRCGQRELVRPAVKVCPLPTQ